MRYISLFALLSVSGTLLMSCGGSESQPQPQVKAYPQQVSFRIDNVVWSAQATISSSGTLSAFRGNEALYIQLPSESPGTYNITSSTSPSIRLSQYGGADYDSYVCNPAGGRVVITANDGTLSGTFSARVCTSGGGQSKDVVEGVFTKIPVR